MLEIIIVMRRILTGFFVFEFFKVKDDKKKEKKEDSEKTVRESIRKSLKDILTTRSVQLSVFCILEVLYVCKIPDYTLFRDVQGWRSGESTCLPPLWPRFDFRTRRHMWVEFVGSLLCYERFFPGYSGFPISPKTNI